MTLDEMKKELHKLHLYTMRFSTRSAYSCTPTVSDYVFKRISELQEEIKKIETRHNAFQDLKPNEKE